MVTIQLPGSAPFDTATTLTVTQGTPALIPKGRYIVDVPFGAGLDVSTDGGTTWVGYGGTSIPYVTTALTVPAEVSMTSGAAGSRYVVQRGWFLFRLIATTASIQLQRGSGTWGNHIIGTAAGLGGLFWSDGINVALNDTANAGTNCFFAGLESTVYDVDSDGISWRVNMPANVAVTGAGSLSVAAPTTVAVTLRRYLAG